MGRLVEYFQRHGSLRLPWHTMILGVFSFALYAGAGPAAQSLIFDRHAIADGQLWRLVTGHWAHGDPMHLLWNLLAFVLVGGLLERRGGSGLLYLALFFGTLGVSIGVWHIPGLQYYCGLSGVLNTLMYIYIIDAWIRHRDGMFLLVLAGASTKIAYEIFFSTAVFTDTAWPAVPEAHLAGALAGLVCLAARVIFQTDSRQPLHQQTGVA